MSRERYEQQLRELESDLLRLGSMVENAIGMAIKALKNQDTQQAQELLSYDNEIDQAQYDLEDKAFLIIATQQPMASDLRAISAAISIASELERMGDYAEGIAEITLRIGTQPLPKPLVDIPHMASLAQKMLHSALDSYMRHDADLAHGLSAEDDVVDALTGEVQAELLNMMIDDPQTIEMATNLLYVVHNLERMADRATNIGERVIFMISGKILDLNE